MDQKTFTKLINYQKGSIKEYIVIFDTNVLVDLFYPGNINNRTEAEIEKLEDIYEECLEKGKKIKIIIPIISEFYNLAFKVALDNHNKANNSDLSRKKYRNSPYFVQVNQDIIKIIDSMFKEFELDNMEFDYINVVDKELKLQKLDFTDLIITDYCEKKEACLITLDSDFRKVFNVNLKFSIISN